MTVLLLHGLGGDREQALSLFAPIVPPDTHLLAPDTRGHGVRDESGPAASFALDALADDIATRVVSARDAEGRSGEPLTVIGISMGAAIALRLALRQLLPIDRIVFVRPSFTDQPLPHNLRAFPVIGELLADRGAVEGEKAFLQTSLYADTHAESRLGAAGLLQQFRSPRAAERARRLIEIPRSAAFGSDDDLSSIDLPLAIAWAPLDPVHPVSVAELWMDELSGAASIPIPARDDGYSEYVAAMRAGVAAWLGWA
ncbi:alpha/beta fold hydrolase [Herbiconiux sp. P16]|uniref:alpha/beta fold hydrolase n=1 Tax=Herbiconiux wuyangfengii TaxID=3342794 RepID=UPI0035B92CD6